MIRVLGSEVVAQHGACPSIRRPTGHRSRERCQAGARGSMPKTLEAISQGSNADKDAGDVNKGPMYHRVTRVANVESAESADPREEPLDDPSPLAASQGAAMVGSGLCSVVRSLRGEQSDVNARERVAEFVGVTPPGGDDALRSARPPTSSSWLNMVERFFRDSLATVTHARTRLPCESCPSCLAQYSWSRTLYRITMRSRGRATGRQRSDAERQVSCHTWAPTQRTFDAQEPNRSHDSSWFVTPKGIRNARSHPVGKSTRTPRDPQRGVVHRRAIGADL